MSKPLWTPDEARIKTSAMHRFMEALARALGEPIDNYADLHRFSVEHPNVFWKLFWDFCPIRYSSPPAKIMQRKKRFQDTRWFEGARLNFAENLLSRKDEHPAILFTSERGDYNVLSYSELFQKVSALSHYFRSVGLKPKDRVAAVLPNIPEAVIAMLATASIGAIWTALSPDVGLSGLLDRFSQIEPTLLILVDGHYYKGNDYRHDEKNKNLIEKLTCVKVSLIVGHLFQNPSIPDLKNTFCFEECLKDAPPSIQFEPLPFDHPLYILYSSGTTGKPKCMVHGAGGTLIQHLKELMLHTNLKANDVLFFNTTIAWMMWHWMVSSLALGCTIVLFEGFPFFSKKDLLFDLIDSAKINAFGVGAKFLEMSEKFNVNPKKTHRLSSLQTILTTGSPLLPASFDYVYQKVKAKVQLSSISGGSDLISCFALGNPLLPVYRGELQCLGLGMDVKIFNPAGEPVIGEKGELVCTTPFPSMPLYFWNDAKGKKYQQAYFDKFPNTWTHGDYAEITPHAGMIIYGRSDATLNPRGVRIGSAEIYQVIEAFPEILESAVVPQQWQGDERVILLVIMRHPHQLDERLITHLKKQIRNSLSPHHVPARIHAVKDFPRTLNQKICEVAIKKILNGQPIDNKEALANPECLKEYFSLEDPLKD